MRKFLICTMCFCNFAEVAEWLGSYPPHTHTDIHSPTRMVAQVGAGIPTILLGVSLFVVRINETSCHVSFLSFLFSFHSITCTYNSPPHTPFAFSITYMYNCTYAHACILGSCLQIWHVEFKVDILFEPF